MAESEEEEADMGGIKRYRQQNLMTDTWGRDK